MMSDTERREYRKNLGKHYDSYHNKVKLEEATTLAESQEKSDLLAKKIKHAQRSKQQSKEEYEKMMERRRDKARQLDEKFNNDFLHSEYEYQSHQPAHY